MKLKNTKIITTIGPATDSFEALEKLYLNGMNIVRLNMSHGDFEEQGKRITWVRELEKKYKATIGILLDTKGPEIRTHFFENKMMNVAFGQKLVVYFKKEILGKDGTFSITYDQLDKTVEKGDLILFDDGKLVTRVLKIESDKVHLISENNHVLSNKKAVNIPGKKLLLPFISEYDHSAITWGLKNGIDYIAASFVSSRYDVNAIRKICEDNNRPEVQIISKVESYSSIQNLSAIIRVSDGVMLARGDLGVEIPFEKVPYIQSGSILKCRIQQKPIVIATQMLDSMIDNPRPTRAEVTDVYSSVIDGIDSNMLSGESANGSFPFESVKTMARINNEAERNFNYLLSEELGYAFIDNSNAEAAFDVCSEARRSNIHYIIAISEKGRLVKALTSFRPNANIITIIKDKDIKRKFIINYGVYHDNYSVSDKDFDKIYDSEKLLGDIFKQNNLRKGSKVIVCSAKKYKVVVV